MREVRVEIECARAIAVVGERRVERHNLSRESRGRTVSVAGCGVEVEVGALAHTLRTDCGEHWRKVHIIDRYRDELGISQSSIAGDEADTIDSRLSKIGIKIEYASTVAVVDKRRVGRCILSKQRQCRQIGIGGGCAKGEILALTDGLRADCGKHRRPVHIVDCNRDEFRVGERSVSGDEADIVDSGLREVRIENEGAGAIAVVRERGIDRNTLGGQDRGRRIRIRCGDSKAEILVLVNRSRSNRGQDGGTIGVVDSDCHQFGIRQSAIRSDKANIGESCLREIWTEGERTGSISVVRKGGIGRDVFGGQYRTGGVGVTCRNAKVQHLSLIDTLCTNGGKHRGQIHIGDSDGNDLCIGQRSIAGDERDVVDTGLREGWSKIECRRAIPVVRVRRARGGTLRDHGERCRVGVGRRSAEGQENAFVHALRADRGQHWRPVHVVDGDRDDLCIRQGTIGRNESDIVDAGLSEIRIEDERTGAVAVVREVGVGGNTLSGQSRGRAVSITGRDSDVEIGVLVDRLRTDGREDRPLVHVVDRDRDDFGVRERAVAGNECHIVDTRLGETRCEVERPGAVGIVNKRGCRGQIHRRERGRGGIRVGRRCDETEIDAFVHRLRTNGREDRREVHVVHRDRDDLGIGQGSITRDEPNIVNAGLAEGRCEVECRRAIPVVRVRRARGRILRDHGQRRRVGIGCRSPEGEKYALVDALGTNRGQHWRPVHVIDGDRDNFRIGQGSVASDEGHIVDTRLRIIRRPGECRRAIAIVGVGRARRSIHSGHRGCGRVGIGRRGAEGQQHILVNALRANSGEHWTLVDVVDRDRDDLGVGQRSIAGDKADIVDARLVEARREIESRRAIPVVRVRRAGGCVLSDHRERSRVGIAGRSTEGEKHALVDALGTNRGQHRRAIHIVHRNRDDF